jgi:hypothetical protein
VLRKTSCKSAASRFAWAVVFVLHALNFIHLKISFMNLAFIDTTGLEFLFVSPERTDINLANDILEQKDLDAEYLETLIDYLNAKHQEWHFFMRDCRIQRIKASKD